MSYMNIAIKHIPMCDTSVVNFNSGNGLKKSNPSCLRRHEGVFYLISPTSKSSSSAFGKTFPIPVHSVADARDVISVSSSVIIGFSSPTTFRRSGFFFFSKTKHLLSDLFFPEKDFIISENSILPLLYDKVYNIIFTENSILSKCKYIF